MSFEMIRHVRLLSPRGIAGGLQCHVSQSRQSFTTSTKTSFSRSWRLLVSAVVYRPTTS